MHHISALEPVYRYFEELVIKVAGEESLRRLLSAKDAVLPVRISTHFRELSSKIKDMPFIYMDLERGEVLNEYVEEDIDNLDLESLDHRTPRRFTAGGAQRIRDTRRALILGNAGIGKTTFLRRTALGIIAGTNSPLQFFEGESLVPFYVPLKAINLGEQFPIFHYLVSNYRIAQGSRGLKRLLKFAKRRRLFLLLDGYDEIPFPTIENVQEHPLRAELARIMHGSVPRDLLKSAPAQQRFYDLLNECRIWLTSRAEFFNLYRIPMGDSVRGQGVLRTAAVELRGIGQNRFKLVDTIFRKYKERSSKYQDLLSAEYFIQNIDKTQDEDLIELSFNPLFLTVMCYIYARKVNESNTSDVGVGNTMAEVTLNCIGLLLTDLDKDKARDLSRADRKAYLRRRNEYPDEKQSFLEYFALELLWEAKIAFDFRYMENKIVAFFSDQGDSPNAAAILRNPNEFASQLAFSGLFVLVDKSQGGVMYDFPHRSFREVLAARYIDLAPDPAVVIQHYVGRADMIEALFGVLIHKKEIIKVILQSSERATDGQYGATLRSICLGHPTFDPSSIFQEFLIGWIKSNLAVPVVQELPALFIPTRTFMTELMILLEDAFQKGQLNSLLTCCFLLLQFDRGVLVEWLSKRISTVSDENKLSMVLLAYAAIADPKMLLGSLEQIRKQRRLLWGLCFAVVRALKRIKDPSHRAELCRQLLTKLSREERVAFLYFLAKENNPVLNEIWDLMDEAQERDAALIRNIAHKPETPTVCFAVTSRTIKAITDKHDADNQKLEKDAYRSLESKRGIVYFDSDRLMQGLSDALSQQLVSVAGVPVSTYNNLIDMVNEIANAQVESICIFEDLVSDYPPQHV